MTAIVGIGVYTPRYRIDAASYEAALGRFDAAGVQSTAVPAPDEDPLTMAVAAADNALAAAGVDGAAIDWLGFASSRPPLAEGELTARLGPVLGLDRTCTRETYTASTRAGTRAIIGGHGAIERGAERALVTVGDAPVGEPGSGLDQAAGAGAAAFVLEASGPLALRSTAEYATAAPGVRFRATGDTATGGLGVTGYDRSVFLEAVGGALDGLELPGTPDAVAVQSPDGKRPYRVAGSRGIDRDAIAAGTAVHELGDLGAASVPVGVAEAVRAGHESVVALSFGGGVAADGLAFDRTANVPVIGRLEAATGIDHDTYLRFRGEITGGDPDGGGAYVSMPTWRRSLPQRHRLLAGRCEDCAELVFPPEGACPSCGSLAGYETVRLAETGRVAATTTISHGGAPPEFASYQERVGDFPTAIVAIDGPRSGETVPIPMMVTDATAGDLEIGDPVRTTIRRLYTQEDVTRYGLKVRPKTKEED